MSRFLASLVLSLGLIASAQAAPPLPKPKLIAAYAYADWCPNCKILSPKVKEARTKGDLDNKDVLFVTLDLTNKTTIHQSILHAQALGIGDWLKAQGSGTGYLAILDAGSKKELARFDRENSAADIQKGIESHLAP